ncbi:hypothetical protein AVEN_190187-1, partial [Araneus ventricosus]
VTVNDGATEETSGNSTEIDGAAKESDQNVIGNAMDVTEAVENVIIYYEAPEGLEELINEIEVSTEVLLSDSDEN